MIFKGGFGNQSLVSPCICLAASYLLSCPQPTSLLLCAFPPHSHFSLVGPHSHPPSHLILVALSSWPGHSTVYWVGNQSESNHSQLYYKREDIGYCKSLKFREGFSLRISLMNCFHEIKYHANVLAIYCNNVTNSKSVKLNSNELTFMGKPQNIIPVKHKAFYSRFLSTDKLVSILFGLSSMDNMHCTWLNIWNFLRYKAIEGLE